MPKTRPHRDRKYLDSLRGEPCLLCGAVPSDPAHIRYGSGAGTGRKPSDWFTVPLCNAHHREQHQVGEVTFWHKYAGEAPHAVLGLLRDGARWRYEQRKR